LYIKYEDSCKQVKIGKKYAYIRITIDRITKEIGRAKIKKSWNYNKMWRKKNSQMYAHVVKKGQDSE